MSTVAGEKSRQAFIAAAGRLFAERGIDRVPLSEIARSAGVDASMINYHFGGKDGLVQAVIEQALKKWHETGIDAYYRANSRLLDSREGQSVFITGLVDCVFNTIGRENDDDSGRVILLQLLQHPHPLRESIINRHIRPGVTTFNRIYAKITGSDDFESAFCWYLFLICPEYLCSACPGMIALFHPERKVPPTFGLRLRHVTTKVILAGLGLD
ncbi:MAG: helix-turn-helix domain containing protein [Victivallaceae bacterium]|nr:helix-turn-helix domain containing protein [Victivallaceae bacterium]